MSEVHEVDRPDGASGADPLDAGPARSRMPTARLAASIVGVVLVAFMALLWVSDPGGDQGRAVVGRPVPAVAGEGLDGRPVALDDYAGSWVVVNFFATWCPPCIVEHPELVAFSERHADGRAQVVGVGFEDDATAIEAFFDERGGDWPVIPAGTGPIALAFGVRAMPESYLVSPDGTVVDVFIAGVTADELDEAIAANGGIDAATSPGAGADAMVPVPRGGGVVEHDDAGAVEGDVEAGP